MALILCPAYLKLSAQIVLKEVNAREIRKGNATIAICGARIIDGNGGTPV
jgi:hypothetical protein